MQHRQFYDGVKLMTLNELKEQLQENVCMFYDETDGFDGFGPHDVKDSLCQIIVDTFNDSFYDASMSGIEIISKPLDTAPSI